MLSLIGLDPGVKRRYIWLGDPAVDRDKSDISRWLERGEGLEGEGATVFICDPLRPTTLAIVHGYATMGMIPEPSAVPISASELVSRNFPAVLRAAVAYGVVAIENGPACSRVHDAGGMRLSDALLDQLDRAQVKWTHDGREVRIRLIDHLGSLILSDATATESEGKA